MTEQPDSIASVLIRSVGLIGAWFGTVSLAQVQTVVAIISGLVVAGYAATQWYVLWRDKINGRKRDATD